MCIGNLRSGTESLSVFFREREHSALRKALHYYGIIFIFAIGAGLGGVLSLRIGVQAIWGSCILLVIVYSAVLDKCLMLGTTKMQIKVVSSHIDEIRTAVLKDIDRGVTLLNSETGFLRNNTMMLLTVVSMRELAKTEKLIHEVDPDAFVIINKVSEVSGRGFSSKKRYLKQTGDVEG